MPGKRSGELAEKLLKAKKGRVGAGEKTTKEYEIPTFIPPRPHTNLNTDSIIVFEVKTAENEYFYFNRDFQARIEISVMEEKWAGSPAASTGDFLLVQKDRAAGQREDPNEFYFATASSGLSLFKNISTMYNNSIRDPTFTAPQEGIFYNTLVAQDLFLSSSEEFVKTQASLNNFPPSHKFVMGSLENAPEYSIGHAKKLHKSATDAPTIPNCNGNAAPTALNGKMHYIYIPQPPFSAVNNYIHKRFQQEERIIFPPFTHLRIIFSRNEVKPKYLLQTKLISDRLMVENDDIGVANWADQKKITVYIHSMHLAITRFKLDPRDKMASSYSTNVVINHFDLFEITSATTQKIPVLWRTEQTPLYVVFSFVRQQDVVFNQAQEMPQALNKFYMPQYLSSLTIRQPNHANEIFDGIQVKHLERMDYHPSKAAFIQYLKHHRFVGKNFQFEDLFCVNSTLVGGFTNIFPVDLMNRTINTTPNYKGLEIELGFTQSNTTKWFLVARFVGLGEQILKKSDGRHYSIEFKYD